MPAVPFIRRGLLIACGLSLTCSALAFAAPPTDAEIQAKVEALGKWMKEATPADRTQANYQEQIKTLLKDVNVEELTLAQIDMLSDMLSNYPDKAAAATKRLDTLAADKSVEGANAAVLAVGMSMSDQATMSAALKRALTHPAIVEAARTDTGSQIFMFVGYAQPEVASTLAKEIIGLQSAIGEGMSDAALAGTMQYLTALNELGDKVDAKTKTAVREKISGLYVAAIDKAKAKNDPKDKKSIERMENNYKFLNGAFAKGELIDHHSPAMTFLWSSGETPIKSLDQFKGKVVVVDFWATWCGPCVASFPHVKALQERYKDYNVVIVGVTSPQGKHYPGGGAQPIDCEGHPEKEFELMPAFMKDKDMTWQVAFTQENVFNPDFGVRGIPHVAIIDPAGNVCYNGLHPMMPMKEKAEKIDGLLTKAGLATPGPVVEDEKAPEGAKKPG